MARKVLLPYHSGTSIDVLVSPGTSFEEYVRAKILLLSTEAGPTYFIAREHTYLDKSFGDWEEKTIIISHARFPAAGASFVVDDKDVFHAIEYRCYSKNDINVQDRELYAIMRPLFSKAS